MERNEREEMCVRQVVDPCLVELRGFDYAKCPTDDLYAFVGWIYEQVCEKLSDSYGDEPPF